MADHHAKGARKGACLMQRRPRRLNPRHCRWIAERHCLICGQTDVQVAHIKFADGRILKPLSSNIGMKADDRFTLPLCIVHHAAQHAVGERKFWQSYHLDPVLIALHLYSISGDDEQADHFIRTCNVTLMIIEDQAS